MSASRVRWAVVGATAAMGIGALAGVNGGVDLGIGVEQASAQGATKAQVRTTQRIASAAVRRSNEALAKIATLTTQVAALQAAIGSGGGEQPAPQPSVLWAVSNGSPQESLVTTRGGNGVTSIFQSSTGTYTVKFTRNIASCSYAVTLAADNRTDLTAARGSRVALDLADAARTQLLVFTHNAAGNPSNSPFHVQVYC